MKAKKALGVLLAGLLAAGALAVQQRHLQQLGS